MRRRDPERQLEQRLQAVEALSRYTYAMLAAVTGHRVLNETAKAKVHDFCLHHQLAAVVDKAPNAMHIWRIVALCPLFCDQLRCYLDALEDFLSWLEEPGLKIASAAGLIKTLRSALNGRGQIFLVRDGALGLRAGTPKLLWPNEFAGLPLNFQRHRLARALRASRTDALDIGIQLSHYFGRQPYGDDSLDTPLLHGRRIGIKLQLYAEASGWRVISSGIKKPGHYRRHWSPDWRGWQKLAGLRVAHETAHRTYRKEVLALAKTEAKRLADLIDHALDAEIEGDGTPANARQSIKIDKEQLARISRTVLTALPNDPRYKEISIRALRRRLINLRRKRQWQVALPPKRVEVPPRLPTITPYHLRANADLVKIRQLLYSDHLDRNLKCIWPEQLGDVACYNPLELAVAILFFDYGITDSGMLMSAVRALDSPTSCKTAQHVLVLALDKGRAAASSDSSPDDSGAISNFRGGALPVCGRAAGGLLLARDYVLDQRKHRGGLALPTSEADILQCLNAVLPPPLRLKGRHALRHYQNTVNMALRVERPGPLMLTSSGSLSTPLTPRQYRGAMLNDHTPKCMTLPVRVAEPPDSKATLSSDDKAAYDELLNILGKLKGANRKSRNMLLYGSLAKPDVPDAVTPDTSAAPSLLKLSGSDNANIAALAAFALHTAERRKHSIAADDDDGNDNDDHQDGDDDTPSSSGDLPKKKRLVGNSIYRYINSFGWALLYALKRRAITSLDEDELEDAFQHAVLLKPESSMEYTLTQLDEFYRYLRRSGRLTTRISFANIADELPVVTRYCEPGFVSRSQYLDAHQQLLTWIRLAKKRHGPRSILVRRLSVARIALILMYWAGLRVSEVQRIRFCDLVDLAEDHYLWIHPTQHGGPKSDAGIRFLHISELIDAEDLAIVLDWVRDEQLRQGFPNPRNPIFAVPNDSSEPMSTASFGRLLSVALKVATGNPDARPHWLRHTTVMRWMAPRLLSAIPDGLEGLLPGDIKRCPLVDGLRIAHDIGHAALGTAFGSYEHLRGLAVAERQIEDMDGISDFRLATAYGISEDLLRQYRRTLVRGGTAPSSKELAAAILRNRLNCDAASSKRFWPMGILPTTEPRKHVRLSDMAAMLGDLQRGTTWTPLAHRFALSEATGRRLFRAILAAQSRTGYWLLTPPHLNALRMECGERNDRVLAARSLSRADKVQLTPVLTLLEGTDAKLPRIDYATRKALHTAIDLFRYGEDDSRFVAATADDSASLRYALSLLNIDRKALKNEEYVGRHVWCALLCINCLLIIRRQ